MKCGRGRPHEEVTKSNRFELRLGDDETQMLEYLCFKLDKSRADVMRDALKMYYDVQRYRD